MQNINSSFSVIILLFFSSCHWLDSGRLSQKEINIASSWSTNDQYPTFESCDKVEGEDQRKCFSNIVSEAIKSYLNQQQLISSISIEEEIFLNIKIDKEGFFSLLNMEASESITSAIPDLQNIITDAVYSIPQAIPALKTNVGEIVDSQLLIPIQINAKKNL